jgi:hypothetical protein
MINEEVFLDAARFAYTSYYGPWLQSDSRELVIANMAAAMGIAGCPGTFVERKRVAQQVLEEEKADEQSRLVSV